MWPLIVKKFLEVNYERCREVEAELTEYMVEAYRGFATIKLNNLNALMDNILNEIRCVCSSRRICLISDCTIGGRN